MSEPTNLNSPAGAVPPKKETGKVQPKKETVRINLPPKPTAAPTIKLPTLPPGGPVAAAAPAAAPVAAAAAPATPKAAPAPTATPRATGAPTPVPAKPGAPRVVPGPKPKAAVSGLDIGLAIAAAVAGLAAIGSTLYIMLGVIN